MRPAPLPARALVACLLTTSALVSVTGPFLHPSAAAADSGDPCVFVGNACTILSAGTSPNDPPPDGTGNPGSSGGPAAPLTTTLDNPQDLTDFTLYDAFSALDMEAVGGTGDRGANNSGAGGGWGGAGGAGGDISLTVVAPSNPSTPNGESTSVLPAVLVSSTGGEGGGAGVGVNSEGGVSGPGGDGGTVTVPQLDGLWVATSDGSGAHIVSSGGTGGGGRPYVERGGTGSNGGVGGNGNAVDVTLTGSFVGTVNGAYVGSAGGDGGTGGTGDSAYDGQGANGGDGGNGADVTVTLATGASLQAAGPGGAGLWAQSVGGQGGQGGGGEIGGTGGQGGNAGSVDVTVNGTIVTGMPSDYVNPSPGVLAQSIGNIGGGGGHASDWSFNPTGGNGNTGGTANTVTVQGNGAQISTGDGNTDGDLSPGVLAQSIGGAGGVGPDETGIFAVGGTGGDGSNGSTVSATLTDSTVKTVGFSAGGIVAQSIGGGGGKGGDATTSNGVLVNMDIGGTGGNGGDAGSSYAGNLGGSIVTSGDHSPGVIMQSVGGGGGAGGAAYGKVSSKIYGAQISVGGNGGAGGDGSYANADETENNSGRIATSGAESFGILAQSIGGGGGQGGASTAKAIVKGSDDYPSFNLTMATGGDGGTAGDGGQTYVQSTGLITTTGNGAIGILAQSIGGGGGTGGDADASSKSSGGNYGLTAAVAHGGKGQSGGSGALAWAQNGGLIITTGESADGMLIQSIGGGGGSGGAGDAKASDSADDASITLGLAIGGQAGAGGTGADVKGNNSGSIITLGDGAVGLAVQTIGGGGGRGGGAAASASGTFSAGVSVGGIGGDGGNTYYTSANSEVTNSGSIATFGADAPGIVAQSIGGGGGAGGKAGSSLGDAKNNGDGSNGSSSSVNSGIGDVQADFAANGTAAMQNYDSLDDLLATTNSLLGNDTSVSLGDDDVVDNLDDTSETGGEDTDDNESKSISLSVSLGGSGGSGGAAGFLNVTNTGTIGTMGKHSDAIVVQSIGGGGGRGGAASTASSGDISGSVAIGGNGGDSSDPNANNGGQPTVTNSGQVYTIGALSSAIVAQSIGGGGGIAGTSSVSAGTSSDDRSYALKVGLGGLASVRNGMSEQVVVTNTGAIETRGHDSYGIIAQSISGGGGILKSLATDLDNRNGSGAGTSGIPGYSSTSKAFDVDVSLGQDGTIMSGVSGAVFVTNDTGGSIVTSGDNGIGILAQSVAAGGGLALGGRPTGTTAAELLGTGTKDGSVNQGDSTTPSDNEGVHVTVNGSIATSGAGGVGVFAQSVGGGGGIAGDIGNTMDFGSIGGGEVGAVYAGNGGDIDITVGEAATISTSGKNAPGIIAQSVGGGGGWFAGDTYALVGSAGGTGTGGNINVTVNGVVDAQGSASAGVLVQSTGGGARPGGAGAGQTVSVTNNGWIWGGAGDFSENQASVYVLGAGSGSTLTNYGVINTHESSSGYAVYVSDDVPAGNFTATNETSGYIGGNVNLSSNDFVNNGIYVALSTVALGDGTLTNAGTLDLTAGPRLTSLTGDLHATPTSRLVVGANFAKGTADRLAVSGKAELAGGVEVRPETLVPNAATVLTASNGLDGQHLADLTGAYLYDFTPTVAGNAATITPSADFRVGGLSRDEKSLAGHLQRVWDGDDPETMAKGFAALAGVKGADDYTDTLDHLASRQVGAIATARMESSRLFVANMQSCPTFAGTGLMIEETDCAWGRAITARLDHDGSSDAAGFDTDATLLQFGGQRRLDNGLFLSGAVGWETPRLRDDFGASADGESWMAGLGVKYQSGPLLASATVDLGFGNFDTTRSFTVGGDSFRATGSPDARNAGLHGRIAYELPYDSFYLRPSLDLDASWISLGSYDESGAGDFDLAVDESDSWVLSASPAVEVGARVDLRDGTVLRPFANVGARFTSGNDWTVDASFLGAPGAAGGFSSKVDNPDAVATFGAGVTVMTKGNLDLTAQYQGAFADGYTAQSGALKVTWRF